MIRDRLPPFTRPELLEQALTHSSHANEQGGPDNERLEFLGDAVLQLCSTVLLVERFPEVGEGELTRLRQLPVRGEALAGLGRSLELGAELKLGIGEDTSGGRQKDTVLAAVVEAVLGAVFEDQGFAAAEGVVRAWMQPALLAIEAERATPEHDLKHPKNRLQERTQRDLGLRPVYVYTQEGPPHEPTYAVELKVADRVLARASGRSKSEAARKAAEAALAAPLAPEAS